MKERIDNLKVTINDKTNLIYLIYQEFKRIEKENKRATTSDIRKSQNQRFINELDSLLNKVLGLFSEEDKDGENN